MSLRGRRTIWVGAAAVAVVAAALALFLWLSLGPVALVADPADARQVALGQAVYDRACASCHGKNLEGQPNWQQQLPTGGLPAPPHDETGHTWHHADELLFRVTKHGGQSVAPRSFKSNMPAFAGTLTDAEIMAALAYIKSRWPAPIRERQAELSKRQRGQ